MKVKLLLALPLFACQFGFSQTEKPLKGKVSCENFLIQNVNVINKTSKISTTTNEKGEFVIAAKANDSLFFYTKDYSLKRLKLTPENIELNNLTVSLIKKPEELEEVVITKMSTIELSKDKAYEQGMQDKLALEKKENSLKNNAVYYNPIENGMDLIRIGGMIANLFTKEKEEIKKSTTKKEFKDLAKSSFDQEFYTETLKLNPQEIALFLDFCDADPKSKILSENDNILSLMDFLFAKNIEFKKL